ncbi:MAG: hypothetical protein ABSB59_39220 [Streptosporangiaceae bacterium]|jgi:hypothetical protein
MRWGKVLGVAAFAGVAATGAVVIRDQRRRRAYTPDEIRDRLHTRLSQSPHPPGPPPPPEPPPPSA